jgi:hypothetical protein
LIWPKTGSTIALRRAHRAPGQCPELPGHAFAAGQAGRWAAARRGGEPLPVRLPAGGDVGVDASSLQLLQILLGAQPASANTWVGRCCRVRPRDVTAAATCSVLARDLAPSHAPTTDTLLSERQVLAQIKHHR